MARIDQQTVERILEAADIVDIVGEYVDLRRRGANYMGLCPFHNERTPSFSVSRSKGICKCFSCGKGGNVVNFLMEIEQIGYSEALRRLARRYGIEIKEEELTDDERRRRQERDSLFATLDFAAGFFASQLALGCNADARGFFDDWGASPQVITDYRLGLVPADRSALGNAAAKAGFQSELLAAVGLTDPQGRSLFADALAIPLANHFGKVVGFAMLDRATERMVTAGPGQLLRLPELLYGYTQARREIGKSQHLYLASSIREVLTLASAGVAGAVAPLAPTLEPNVVNLIQRSVNEVTLLLPRPLKWRGYEAMREAARLLEQKVRVWVVSFGGTTDCLGFASTHPGYELQEAVGRDSRTDMVLFKLNAVCKVNTTPALQQFSDYLTTDLLMTLAAVSDPLSREVYVDECASRLSVKPSQLLRMIADAARSSGVTFEE